ncbi:uncharacterized protein LOC131008789 [Salvia miltiorrhiza]|uniref:uncharacterized protein LOC131008789 n=1 Tax=Salvia miltiorrhiza TaxID=226208 RepID=UPI0025ACA33C|nr:uncharacterized protein LOC131008789 [Salvia miltiorrhiza]XP_057791800.1 uncharacterized protein LOC131008789 [Salvia miltiorrhiza]XP_057791801.1 uncharacterized protein LOC131008789 [Salvia miltiorrhiza]
MNSVQGGAESISCNVNMSLAQEKNDIVGNKEIREDAKDIVTYQPRKRLKKADLSDLPRTDLESFSEGDDLSLGNVSQIIENHSLVQPIEFKSVPHRFSSSMSEKTEVFEDGISAGVAMSEKKEAFEDGISAEVVQMSLDESLHCSSEILNTSLNNSTHAMMKSKSCDAGMPVSDHLEELHDEAKEITSVVDGDASGEVTPLYHEEQSVASHDDLSLDDTQGVVCETIIVPVDRAFTGYMQKKLLVLDLNGLLLDICSFVPYNCDPDDIIMKKAVFRRPHCNDFLDFCFEKFNVGFWTSRTKRNMEPLLEFLLGNNKSRLLFYWDQSHCTDTGYYTVEKKNKPLLLKKLKKLWDKCEPGLPWERGVYNESNTLLLDDTPCKALTNPPYTAVFPYTYRFRDVKDNSLGPGGDLRVYLEGLAEAENVQEYVKQNPFGQRPITEKNLSWGYYRKVIAANSTPPRQTDTGNP